MGWITRNGKKYYRIKKTVGKKLNNAGNEIAIVKSFEARTKKEAEAKYKEYLERKASGIEYKNQYFGILAEGWINEFYLPDPRNKDTTKLAYLNAWNNHVKTAELYTLPLDDITAKTIQALYNKLNKNGVPSSTISKANKLMRKFYSYLETEGYSRDVTRNLTIPKEDKEIEEKEIVVWTDEEARTIFGNFDKADKRFRLKFLITLAYYTGCRIGELLAIKYDDFADNGVKIYKQVSDVIVDYDKNGKPITEKGITEPKSTKSIRTIPVNHVVLEALQEHRRWHIEEQLKNGYRTDFVFTTDMGQLYDDKNVSRALDRYYKRIGVERKGLHTYRHTFGTNLCAKGVPIQTASSLLGHEDINTTARYYVNVSEAEKLEAVNSLIL